jgi:hypothetical protein
MTDTMHRDLKNRKNIQQVQVKTKAKVEKRKRVEEPCEGPDFYHR